MSRSTLRKIGLSPALLVLCLAAPAAVVRAQTMSIEEYAPKSTLVVPEHHPAKSKFPFIDVHNHQDTDISERDATRLVAEMDRIGMRVMVNLSGESGAEFAKGYRNLPGRYPGRFVVFANVDFAGLGNAGWGERAAAQLAEDVKRGARGLKIYKNLGMSVVDSSGRRVAVDDPRLDPVWDKCGELGIPVLIHSGEPRSFLDPEDKYNERWLELKQFPARRRPPEKYPPFGQTLMTEQHHLFAKHPKTRFIDAHLGWLGGDLARLGKLLDELPQRLHRNRCSPRRARPPAAQRPRLVHPSTRTASSSARTPGTPRVPHLLPRARDRRRVLRLLPPRHAFWKMYGLALPDEVLRKLYYKNALHVIPGIDPAAFPP